MTYEDLVPGVMPYNTLKKLLTRHNAERVQRGGGEGTCAFVVWESLPKKYREKYVDKYGNPAEAIKKAMIKERIKLDTVARTFYETYAYELNGEQTHMSGKLIEEYTINASVLGVLQRKMNDRNALRAMLNTQSRSEAWKVIQEQCEELRETYGHTLPRNLARLKDRLNTYKDGGYASLISGKVGNQNTLKITEEVGNQIVALKRSRVPVYNDTQLFEKINEICTERGWKTIKSQSGLTAWLNSAAVQPLWYDAVYGEQAARMRFMRRHTTILPERRDSLWYGDGTKLNLYYRDDKGNVRTTGVYEVIDAATEVLLGYYISDTEDYIAQYHAFRMAVQTSRHKPYEIVTDNQGGHKKNASIGFFSKISLIHRPSAPYNGRSKTIENIFYRFQHQVLARHFNFTGQNVTTKKDSSHPNTEYLEANVDKLPTYDELLDIYAGARKEWNDMKHPKTGQVRMETYAGGVNEDTPSVNVSDMIDMFWYTTEKPVTFTASGIEITIQKHKYAYEVFSAPGEPDMEWRRTHTYEKFYVQYDPYDMTSVRLITQDGRFARVANPPIKIHRAQQDQTPEEKQFIRDMRDAVIGERVEQQIKARKIEQRGGTAPEQHGMRSPKLKSIPKDAREQIDRRTALYNLTPEEYQTGRVQKKLSNMDWMETAGVRQIDRRKTVGKL